MTAWLRLPSIASSAALVGNLDGGNVVLSTASATGAFSDKNVANGKTVQIAGLTISGSASANYSLTQPTTTANITAKALTVTGSTAAAKVYDGTTAEALGRNTRVFRRLRPQVQETPAMASPIPVTPYLQPERPWAHLPTSMSAPPNR